MAIPWALFNTCWENGTVGSSQCRNSPRSTSLLSRLSICIQSINPSRPFPVRSSSITNQEATGPDARRTRLRAAPSIRVRVWLSRCSASSSNRLRRYFASCIKGADSWSRLFLNARPALITASGAGYNSACKSYKLSGLVTRA